jgi:hypothetical protein
MRESLQGVYRLPQREIDAWYARVSACRVTQAPCFRASSELDLFRAALERFESKRKRKTKR